jgi:hypothetical protein
LPVHSKRFFSGILAPYKAKSYCTACPQSGFDGHSMHDYIKEQTFLKQKNNTQQEQIEDKSRRQQENIMNEGLRTFPR